MCSLPITRLKWSGPICETIQANNVMTTVLFGSGRSIARRPTVVRVPAILYPFHHITFQIVQTKCIRLLPAHSLTVAGAGTFNNVPKIGSALASPFAVRNPRQDHLILDGFGCARPRGIFPLRFGWQSVGLARFGGQPQQIRLCVRPTHAHYWMLVRLWISGIHPCVPPGRRPAPSQEPGAAA